MGARLVLAVLVGVTLVGGLASASELDDARGQAERAQRQRDDAAAANVAAERQRNDADAAVAAALSELRTALDGAAGAQQRHLELVDGVAGLEDRVAALRSGISDRAVEAYMWAAFGPGLAVWQADSFEEVALLNETAREAAFSSGVEIDLLESARAELELVRAEAADEAARSALLHGRADSIHDDLQGLLVLADTAAASTLANLAVTEAAYASAMTELEAAERRAAVLAGVEYWRPLVATHFPAELVDDALRVMHCESRGNPDAVNPTSDASGLFQFLDTTWAWVTPQIGLQGRSRFDAEANVAAAWWLVDYTIRTGHPRGTWAHWTCQP